LDLLILFTGHEAALGIMKWQGTLDHYLGLTDHFTKFTIDGSFGLLCCFLTFGGLFSLPCIFFIQFVVRRRHSWLSSGEWCAVVFEVLWLVMLVAYYLGEKDTTSKPVGEALAVVLSLACLAIFLLSMAAMPLFLISVLARDEPSPCRWLENYGFFLIPASATYLWIFIRSLGW
jgi:hypothetical protein